MVQLERWAEAVRDYEVLRRERPGDSEVAESLHRAQVALKKSYGEGVHNKKFDGEVEEVSSLDKFRAVISSPCEFNSFCSLRLTFLFLLYSTISCVTENVLEISGVSVVHFKVSSNEQCEELSPFINMLCVRYPSVKFFKVNLICVP